MATAPITPVSVTINPNTPPGTEPLKLGPPRFHEIKQAILALLGLSPATQQSILQPFWYDTATTVPPPGDSPTTNGLLSVLGDPDAPFGIATKNYVDNKIFLLPISGGPNSFSAAVTPNVPGTIYQVGTPGAVGPIDPGNAGAVTIMNVSVTFMDGSTVTAGNFFGNSDYLAVFDGTTLRLIYFIGGTLNQVLTLGTDGNTVQDTALADPSTPNLNELAATKKYVDGAAASIAASALSPGVPVPVGTSTSGTDLGWSVSVVIPNDGHQYLVFLQYFFYLNAGLQQLAAAWIEDDTGSGLKFLGSGGQTTLVCGASGYAPAPYAAGTTVAFKVFARVSNGGGSPTASQSGAPGADGAPASTLTATLVRALA